MDTSFKENKSFEQIFIAKVIRLHRPNLKLVVEMQHVEMAQNMQKLHGKFKMADCLLGLGHGSKWLFVSLDMIHMPFEICTCRCKGICWTFINLSDMCGKFCEFKASLDPSQLRPLCWQNGALKMNKFWHVDVFRPRLVSKVKFGKYLTMCIQATTTSIFMAKGKQNFLTTFQALKSA